MLDVSDLTLAQGGRMILHNVHFSLPAGQVIAVVGPSGSGKTTLLGALSGDLPHRGTVRINGVNPRGAGPTELARHRAVLAQETQVAFAFTVAEVVAMGGFVQNAPHPMPMGERIDRLLGLVGLPGMGGRGVQTLSGGERQRVHLARVLLQAGWPLVPGKRAQAPFWLFLDEPVSSLDIAQQVAVMRLARAHADAGGGVLAVMHDLNLSAMFADQMVVMCAGRVVGRGPVDQAFSSAMVRNVYGCDIPICETPAQGPWMLVQAARGGRGPGANTCAH